MQLNDYYQATAEITTSVGKNSSSVNLSNGNYVVVGANAAGNTGTSLITLFNADGTIKTTTSLQSGIRGDDGYAQPVPMANGEFAVFYKTGFTLFNANGSVKQAHTVFPYGTTGGTGITNGKIEAALLGNGEFAVIYSNVTDAAAGEVFYRTIKQDGTQGSVGETKLSFEDYVWNYNTNSQATAYTAVSTGNGGVLLEWNRSDFGGYVLLNSSGSMTTAPTSFAQGGQYGIGSIRDHQAITLQGGGAAVLTSNNIAVNRTAGYTHITDTRRNILLNIYETDGSRGETIVVDLAASNDTSTNNSRASMCQLKDGTIVVAYMGDVMPTSDPKKVVSEPLGDNSLMARFYSPKGEFLGWQSLTSLDNIITNQDFSISATSDGGFAVEVSQGTTTTTTWHYTFDPTTGGAVNGIQGSAGSETLIGTDGNDYIVSNDGYDKIYAGGGDDTVVANYTLTYGLTRANTEVAWTTIDGGTGVNTLKLVGGQAFAPSFDLTNATVDANLNNFTKFDLKSSPSTNITLNVSDVLASNMAVNGVAKTLMFTGDATSTIRLDNLLDGQTTTTHTWSTSSNTTIGGVTYKVYTFSGDATVQALIESALIVNLI